MKKVVTFSIMILIAMGFVFIPNENVMADTSSFSYGYTVNNPVTQNTKFVIADLKTKDGEQKKASIQVLSAVVDNEGYKKALRSAGFRENKEEIKIYNYMKVKVAITAEGYTGNKEGLIILNMLSPSFYTAYKDGSCLMGGSLAYGFPNAVFNKVSVYPSGKAQKKGIWYDKTMKALNLNKPVSLSGYVYIPVEKGKESSARLWIPLDGKNEDEKENIYLNLNNE